MILPGPGGPLAAKAEVPPSKSATNRALAVCAAAGGGEVLGPLDSDDTRVLAAALAEAGWPVSWQDGLIRLDRRTPTTGRRESTTTRWPSRTASLRLWVT